VRRRRWWWCRKEGGCRVGERGGEGEEHGDQLVRGWMLDEVCCTAGDGSCGAVRCRQADGGRARDGGEGGREEGGRPANEGGGGWQAGARAATRWIGVHGRNRRVGGSRARVDGGAGAGQLLAGSGKGGARPRPWAGRGKLWLARSLRSALLGAILVRPSTLGARRAIEHAAVSATGTAEEAERVERGETGRRFSGSMARSGWTVSGTENPCERLWSALASRARRWSQVGRPSGTPGGDERAASSSSNASTLPARARLHQLPPQRPPSRHPGTRRTPRRRQGPPRRPRLPRPPQA